MSVVLLHPAGDELQDAIDFYNDQMEGLGDRFYQTFLRMAYLVEQNPELWRKVGSNTRRMNLGRFPFFVLYVFDDPDVLITCIAHQHRDPEYYIERVI